ncbi:hypothetical protein COCNU_07G012960 [Cocos nucifera]|uniref:C2H2-type domain-containing protein n=1 Tax=Cocos nucifera TaxID=13894 RepID=A0A8K0IGR4_COCNU|nr:hypothetical protein COCNU_07G012960 [Cocos nucifera]
MTNPPPTLTNKINFNVPGSLPIMNQQFLLANALGRSFFSPTRGLNHHLVQASISQCFSPIIAPEKSSFCYSERSFSIRTDEHPNSAWNASFQQNIFRSGYFDLANQAAFMAPGHANPFHDPNLQSICPLPKYENLYGDCPSNGSPLTSQEMNTRYKCDLCSAEFPTGQAYGGHMSSHSKIRKADRAPGEPSKRLKKFKTIPWTPEISNDGKELNLHFFNETAEEKEKRSSDNVGLKSSTKKDEKKKSVTTNQKEKGKSSIGERPTKAPSYMDDEFANREAILTGTTSLRLH